MKILNDYRCTHCGTVQELWLDNDTEHTECHVCEGVAAKIITGTNFTLEGCTGDFPGAHMKWAKKRDQKIKQEQAQGITAFGEPNQ